MNRGNGRLVLMLAGVLVVLVVAYVAAGGGADSSVPYSTSSSAPSGLRALATLIDDRGVTVVEQSATIAAQQSIGSGDALLVTAPNLATASELEQFAAAARRGAEVVFLGEVVQGSEGDVGTILEAPPDRELADTASQPAARGACEIESLGNLRQIDVAFTSPIQPAPGDQRCFSGRGGVAVTRSSRGAGHLWTLASPEMLVNARLWPAKEGGGEPLDNASLGLVALGVADAASAPGRTTRVIVTSARPSAGAPTQGSKSLTDLLPLGVQMALLQLVVAVAMYSWWRGRRFGEPVSDAVPVNVAGSELVVAVGDLMRRRGSAALAASALRADARQMMAERLGLPVRGDSDTLVSVVADRTARPLAEIAELLVDPPVGRAVTSTDAVVLLASELDRLRQEALHEQPIG